MQERAADGTRYRVMIVDGIGNAELIPVSSWLDAFARRKTRRKIRRFRERSRRLQAGAGAS